MKTHPKLALPFAITAALAALAALATLFVACGDDGAPPDGTPLADDIETLSLTSDAFATEQPIPSRFTCDGEDVSPALSWDAPPPGTEAFALILDDPDAGDFTHWVLFDLPADLRALPEAVPPEERPDVGGVQASNDFGRTGYGGPCPPEGPAHRYRFSLYALSQTTGLEPGASRGDVFSAIQGTVIARGELIGTYQR